MHQRSNTWADVRPRRRAIRVAVFRCRCVSELIARWRAPVADAYTRFGASRADAEAHATVLMAALEGALVLARAQREIEPLDTVERYFASRAPVDHDRLL
jgi:hypothetical protein